MLKRETEETKNQSKGELKSLRELTNQRALVKTRSGEA